MEKTQKVSDASNKLNEHLYWFGELLTEFEKSGLSTLPELVAVRSSANNLAVKMKALTQVLQSHSERNL